MITIYGNAVSTCTRKVLMTLAETNTPYELAVLDFAKGEHKHEQHVRRQPFGRMPALDDDGFQMFESRAICRYIARKAGGTLIPSELRAFAKMEQWISIETSEFSAHAMKFVFEHVFKRPQQEGVLDAAGKALDATCTVMDRQLAQSPFVAGPAFTLADVCFMPYLEYGMGTPAKEIFAKHGHVMTWWNAIRERPTWRKATGKA
ncbi:MAG: glutathione S-transferase N-terminal domain-containing protein [Myxococcota bacterium]|nr:glutathione S-transferase N-terminal domain-containing protein [Myxococcota bacterium]